MTNTPVTYKYVNVFMIKKKGYMVKAGLTHSNMNIEVTWLDWDMLFMWLDETCFVIGDCDVFVM